jgi:hypothetical protein
VNVNVDSCRGLKFVYEKKTEGYAKVIQDGARGQQEHLEYEGEKHLQWEDPHLDAYARFIHRDNFSDKFRDGPGQQEMPFNLGD